MSDREKSYKTKEYKISTLMRRILDGDYIIPTFQRDYVWKAPQICSLMQSISKNFPIGIITIVNAQGSTFNEGKNKILDIIIEAKANKEWIVVDGQQRITSLSIVYFAPIILEKINKLNTADAKMIKNTFKTTLFYNNKFYDKASLEKKLEESRNTKADIMNIISNASISNSETNEKVKCLLDNYKMNLLELNDWSNEDTIEIFTAMNRGAKPLTHVDLMNGSMFNSSGSKFDLLSYIKKVNEQHATTGSIKQEFFVQLIKIFFDIYLMEGEVKYAKKDLLSFSLNKSDVRLFMTSLEDFEEKLSLSMSLLETKFGIFTIENLPKNVYLSIALALICRFKEISDIPDGIYKRAISHISKRLLRGEYASSPGAKTLEDINKVILKMELHTLTEREKELINKEESFEKWETLLKDSMSQISYKNKNNALFKMATSILASEHPRNILSIGKVPVNPTKATNKDTDLHHFIPTKSKFIIDNEISSTHTNSIGNIVLITQKENRNEIRNKELSEYLNESKNILGNSDFRAMLKSHLFDEELIENVIKTNSKIDILEPFEAVHNLWKTREEKICKKIWKTFFEIKYPV